MNKPKPKHIDIKLTESFEYAYDGEMTKAQFVRVSKPTAKNMTGVYPGQIE